MKISKKGIDFIKSFEGFRAEPYLCPAGIPTIGYGFTYYLNGKSVTMSDVPISEVDAEIMLIHVLQDFEKIVNNKIYVVINQSQFDALVSHTFNTGGSKTLFNLVNQREFEQAEDWIRTRYITAGGQRMKGLIRRRKAEAELFVSELNIKQDEPQN